ncbi:hypothetical protein F5878DRAFT_641865 [Lentinula raphanica]|uniref:Uncharacterized protein n=1 Tax=Lentinula raphanica TaxID=153919 RepID=A0AA38P9D5_9AGAR|nr:hypothetical protein F5878DRAFT_641865 [Lentinula raphanica]
MRLLFTPVFCLSFLCGPAHIFAIPVTTTNSSVPVHSNEDLEPTLPKSIIIHPRYNHINFSDTAGPNLDLSLQLKVYTEDRLEDEDFPEEWADKFRNAAEILLPWFLPILYETSWHQTNRDHITTMELPNNRLSFRATELIYDGRYLPLGQDPHDRVYYKMDVKIFLNGEHLERYHHYLYFLKSIFDEARTPLGVADVVRLEGRGVSAECDWFTFVGFLHERFGATFKRHLVYRELERGPFKRFHPEMSQWEHNTNPITKTVVPSTVYTNKHDTIFRFQDTETQGATAKAKGGSWKEKLKRIFRSGRKNLKS